LPKFFPPTVEEGPAGSGLFYRYTHLRGVSVLKTSGVYATKRYPTQDEINAATEYYAGGHEHEVTSAQKSAIIAAGIGITESNFEG
jgi:hypothetical protein